jgi:hypothetical protein
MEELLLIIILSAVITNASKTGRTDILGSSAYFVNKCSYMFYWSNEYNYLVEKVEYLPLGEH